MRTDMLSYGEASEPIEYPVLEVGDLNMTDLPAIVRIADDALARVARDAARQAVRDAQRLERQGLFPKRLVGQGPDKGFPAFVKEEVQRRCRAYVTRKGNEVVNG